MARPTKFNKEIAAKFIGFISDGLSIRLACKGCDVSEDSVARWRDKYPSFDKSIAKACNREWKTSESLLKYGGRSYKRNERAYTPILSSVNPVINGLKYKVQPANTFLGLPIKKEYPKSLEETARYYNQTTNQIEWVDKNGVFHVCSVECYKRIFLEEPNHINPIFIV